MASGSGQPCSPPPVKKSRTRQLTLEESGMTSETVGGAAAVERGYCTPPLFSDSESEQGGSQPDDAGQLQTDGDDLRTATLSYPSSPASGTTPPSSRGVPLSEISFGPSCSPILPPLTSSPSHTITFHPRLRPGQPPRPFPEKLRDVWDGNHVRSPCSPQSLYPVKTDGKETTLMSRWALIRASLSKPIANTYDLEEAIMEYNSVQASKWSFGSLHAYFSEVATEEEATAFFSSLLPKMIRLALSLPEVVTHGLPLLRRQETYSLTISQQQAACLLANAFLCTFPRRNTTKKSSEFSTYPSINFNTLFAGQKASIDPIRAAKFKCIFHYFTRVTSTVPTGTLTYTRQVLSEPPEWGKLSVRLSKLHITSEGTIEDNGHGMLHVDFANKRVGGGVLGNGAVQEEIRFLVCPELILSRLFTEILQDNETLIITGAEQFSSYTGYRHTFEWAGSHTDDTTRDSWGRREVQVVAMDAKSMKQSPESQFTPELMQRELNKAYCGFYSSETTPCGRLAAVATGNWGCGAFHGDKRLKALLQWLAASAAGRDMVYFTFGDTGLEKDLSILQQELTSCGVCVSDVWRVLQSYNKETPQPPLYQFVLTQLQKSTKSPSLTT